MATVQEFEQILAESMKSIEDSLRAEDSGWINLTAMSTEPVTSESRKRIVQEARLYALRDPLASRAIHLMTDYTFGFGFSWSMKDENQAAVLQEFWDGNAPIFSARGQRKSSDKLLIDGEIFFAVFLGSNGSSIRRINPLEIAEVIANPDDMEDVKLYKRVWYDPQGKEHESYYRSIMNPKGEPCKDAEGREVSPTEDALVYHLAINDLGQRGVSYLYPALEWIKLYRKFLASRVAVMLALARFAWKAKTLGGPETIDAIKDVLHGEKPAAGSTLIENRGVDTQPIKVDSGASQAYQDGRQLKLQVSAATGWPEQYFGDISIGNLATARTVELPIQKMCESYQSVWSGAYDELFSLVLEHHGVKDAYVDIDFPIITPEDMGELGRTLALLCQTFPEFQDSQDVKQQALITMGLKDVNEVLEQLEKAPEDEVERNQWELARVLRKFRESLKEVK